MKFNVRTIFIRTFKTLLALVGVLVCLFFGLALYNHYSDEELSPEASAYFSKPIVTIPPPETNAVFAVWGLRVAEGKDPHAVGLAYWNELQLAIKSKKTLPDAPEYLPLPDLPKCPEAELRCMRWQVNQIDLDELLKKHEVLLNRYRNFRQYPHFVSPHQGIQARSGHFALLPPKLHRLWVLEQLQQWNAGNDADFVTQVETDIQYWIKAGSGAAFIIDKVLINFYLQTDYELLMEAALSQPQVFRQHADAWSRMLAPLPASYLDLRGAMSGEYLMNFHHMHELAVEGPQVEEGTDDGALGRFKPFVRTAFMWFFQEHTTQNAIYREMLRVQDAQKKSAAQLTQITEADLYDDEGCNDMSWGMFKNPTGKFLMCADATDVLIYPFKLHHTDSKRRLINIQSQLLQHEPTEYAQIIQNLPADLRNPQNGKPPQLDLKAHLLEFDWATREGESKSLRVGLP